MGTLVEHIAVQAIAKRVLSELIPTIGPGDTERSIATRAEVFLAMHGITETWYHRCPAFVLLGSRSCLSISGREYEPATEPVGDYNLVTIDLSPMRKGVWGDCARSLFVEHGVCSDVPRGEDFSRGLQVELDLHAAMAAYVTEQTTFSDLFQFGNTRVVDHGFENLDFRGNLGHSIESSPGDRRYVEPENAVRLSAAGLFTFEPHIRAKGGKWGFKHENIYYFDSFGHVSAL